MALPIRQGATHKVVIGPVAAVGDGFTPVTSLSLSTADEAEAILHDNGTVVDISGYTFAAITGADGYYHLTLQSGISGTVGHLTIAINDDSLCLPVKGDFVVLEEAVYDAMYAASAPGYASQSSVDSVLSKLLKYFQLLLRKDAAIATDNATEVTAINADGGSGAGAFANTTDSAEALRDRGDAAWGTATGFSTLDADGVRTALGFATANADTQLAAIKSDTAATLTDTNELQNDLTDGGRLDLILDGIDTNVDDIETAVNALENVSEAEVNAQVVDALATDTYSEIGQGSPAATTSLSVMIRYIYKFMRNLKTQTADTWSLFNDAGNTVDQKATVSDDGTTATIGKVVSGP